MVDLISIITATEPDLRNQSLEDACASLSPEALLKQCDALDAFRRRSENLYERVRALFFLYAIHRFHLPLKLEAASRITHHASRSLIPFKGYEHLLQRRFEEAIDHFLAVQQAEGPSDAISSALAVAYYRLGFQTLADQVRRSVRSVRGNQWMFRMGHPNDHPLRIRPELLARHPGDGTYPILRECTPVRMDLTHCGWSDIFFLGMDFPEGAKVLNVSIDLGVHGRDAEPRPPVEAYLRVIEEPLLRLVSVDLGASADITNLAEVFDFAKDYLGLLKAAVIAAGIVPPGIEGSGQILAELLARIVGPGRGLEIASSVNNIPKGSRLAVSTNLLAALISVCMRATGQAASLTGQLQEHERRLVLARALLGEWLGGSGGGWQDSGGVWPGMKLIEGVLASEGDPEYGISRGRLMPQHRILDQADASPETRRKLQESLVLVHGGMAQNVGPILEMVTEKYLLRCDAEWKARQSMLGILNEILTALKCGDVPAIGAATTRNFREPIQSIIPWATNYFTETLIARVRNEFGEGFWGFWMLGGMSGGGMGFIFAPEQKARAQERLQEIMSATKRELQSALPFAMEPVVYDFAINERGTYADLIEGEAALMPPGYYTLTVPPLLRQDRYSLSPLRRAELDKFGAACRTRPELRGVVQTLFDVMLPRGKAESGADQTLDALLTQHGFDRLQHEQTRTDLKEGRIGLAQNRLPPSAVIEDVQEGDVVDATSWLAGPSSAPQPSSGAGVPPVTPGVSPALTTSEKNPRGRDSLATGGTPAPLTPPPFKAFERDRPASISSRRLPHWRQEGATYFVTFRLKDALPRAAVERLQTERDNWLRRHPEPHMSEQLDELHELGFSQLDQELDQGYGACVLNEPEVAEIVEGALRHFDGERYWLGSYVIMPNHVHVLVRPVMQHSLADILHSWKSFTAHAIGNALGRTGSLWQDESFDHIVRNEHQLGRFGLYISANPSKARLAPGKFRLGGGLAMGQPSSGAGVPPVTPGVSPALTTSEENPRGRVPLATGGTPTPLKPSTKLREIGLASLRAGELAVVTLAAGAGSRWTQGAGVVKALHPFCKLGGRHRTFMETHLAKSRRISRQAGTPIPHIFTTSYLTHAPTEEFLARQNHYGYEGLLYLSPGKSVGLRMIPTVRDLRFVWEEMPQQILDEQQQKVRDSLRHALINWARSAGEASDYTDNLPLQCLHPVGHWYEVPNLLRNGVLARLLAERPQLKHLMLHNIDTLGADVDPAVLGWHISSGACLSFEVITRRLEDRGGGLARVNGRVRLVEGLAMPREEVEFDLSYYNSNTCWIDLDKLLAAFALTRPDLKDEAKVTAAIRHLAAKIPTYITIKEVKKRWGHGQEDIFPVTQFEKLWVDMTALPELESRFILVPRLRGQQLKDQAQLDGWLRDGSAAYVESLCEYQD
jgi:REP element-mobilizing transposase RayT